MSEDAWQYKAYTETMIAGMAKLRKEVDRTNAAKEVVKRKHHTMVEFYTDMQPEPALIEKVEKQRRLRQEAIERDREKRKTLLEKHDQFHQYLHDFIDDRSKILADGCPMVYDGEVR
ncbi:hypothetical protein P152DRAFT_261525 [Eremomyces bilateralis CBS 781.70]|uniref:Uncharacterized protein n=1 Tax=Eremomyces bilateralis CBS 781.70 TaxID=1392243 RepID=A0A6G1G7V0_9PEZI|nr:uncharacterized protein P152DRAFT_261525 [Eremomyces bilateralis CBS 781.70]KAF1814113.1 hypothetical protein P152DRAFT_261525 [Eremomyces bilateralis CBS 781.70]